MLNRVRIDSFIGQQPIAVREVLLFSLDAVDEGSAQERLHVIAHLYDVGRLVRLVDEVDFAAELLDHIFGVLCVADAQIVGDAAGVEVGSEFLDSELAVFALVVLDRPMLTPIPLILKEHLLNTIIVDIGLKLPVCLSIRCFLGRRDAWRGEGARGSSGILINIGLQSIPAKPNIPEHVALYRVAFDFLVGDDGLGFRDLELGDEGVVEYHVAARAVFQNIL